MIHVSAVRTSTSLVRSSLIAAITLGSTAALAQTAQPAAPAQQIVTVTPVPSPLAQIPGVTVRYYDVTGTTTDAINASIAAQRPKDATTGVPIPTSATWSIGVNLRKTTTGTVCKLAGATPTFKGEVVLPRLANAEAVPEAVRTHWATYVASLEQRQAERLRQPYQRLGEVERAVMASTCETAGDAANKAIAEITKAPPAPVVTPPAAAAPTR